MKTRESGMPQESTWQDFSEPREVLKALGLIRDMRRVVDFGSGYGTFSLPAAGMIEGEVIGLDIESDLIELCRRKAREAGLGNTRFVCVISRFKVHHLFANQSAPPGMVLTD